MGSVQQSRLMLGTCIHTCIPKLPPRCRCCVCFQHHVLIDTNSSELMECNADVLHIPTNVALNLAFGHPVALYI